MIFLRVIHISKAKFLFSLVLKVHSLLLNFSECLGEDRLGVIPKSECFVPKCTADFVFGGNLEHFVLLL